MRLQPGALLAASLLLLPSCAPDRKPVRHIVAVSTTSSSLTPQTTTTVPPTTTTTAPPAPKPKPSPRPRVSRGAVDRDAVLARIARCEGYPNHVNSDHPGPSSASGKYGVLKGTWAGYGGYPSAKDAPESVQDQWAREAYAKKGTQPWKASKGCWGR